MIVKPAYIKCSKIGNNTPPYEQVIFSIFDKDSNVKTVEFKLTLEQFTSLLLSGTIFREVDVNYHIDKLGKGFVEKLVTFEIPNDVGKNINSYLADQIENLKQDGWLFNTNDIGNSEFLAYDSDDFKAYTIKIYKWE